MKNRTDIRLALPSKGRLNPKHWNSWRPAAWTFSNPIRASTAGNPAVPGLTVLFQRPGDIVVGVRQGSLDGISGTDLIEEKKGGEEEVFILHNSLGFGACSLVLAVPEGWDGVQTVADLARKAPGMPKEGKPLRVATKYPVLTGRFLRFKKIEPFELISSEGTLEVAPAIGYADMISDLVATGTTLRDNHLLPLEDGEIIRSQACLIANRAALKTRPEVLEAAHSLLEYIEAHLRAQEAYIVFANMRGKCPAGDRRQDLRPDRSRRVAGADGVRDLHPRGRKAGMVRRQHRRAQGKDHAGGPAAARDRRQRRSGLAGHLYLRGRTGALCAHAGRIEEDNLTTPPHPLPSFP